MTKDLLGKDYYSLDSARAYWSVSQVKRFKECEARALAELNGEWEDRRDKTALLVGNYVHSAFESREAHEARSLRKIKSQSLKRAAAYTHRLKQRRA